jgi:phosphatidylcholine synthase
MPDGPNEAPSGRLAAIAAFSVHVFTASGAALALLALAAATNRDWPLMFGLLNIALIVDGVDGTLARHLRVAERLPRWSGDTLDLVVDFVTYVFVPAYAIAAGALLPPVLALPGAIVIVVTGALYFADRDMKTRDNHFRGFPAVWNLIAFYLYVLQPPQWGGAAMVAIFTALTFIPVKFVHPLRVRSLRSLNIALMLIWTVLAALAVVQNLNTDGWILTGLCLIALYFLGAGLLPRRA